MQKLIFLKKMELKLSELEGEFAELNGWEAESEAATFLNGLGISEEFHTKKMKELMVTKRLRYYLHKHYLEIRIFYYWMNLQTILDLDSITWLENFLYNFEEYCYSCIP